MTAPAPSVETKISHGHGDLVLGGPFIFQRGKTGSREYIPTHHGEPETFDHRPCATIGCTALVYLCQVRWPSDCLSMQTFETAGGRAEPHRQTTHRHCQAGHAHCIHNGESITCTSCTGPCRWSVHPSVWERRAGKPGASPIATSAIDIRDLDKLALLQALWENAREYPGAERTKWDPAVAQLIMLDTACVADFHHHQGRYLIVDVRSDVIWPFSYDQHAVLPAKQIVEKLRAMKT